MNFIESIRFVFINRHGDLRSGFRLAGFVFLTGACEVLLARPAELVAHWTNGWDYIGQILALVSAGIGTFVMMRFVNRKPFSAVGLGLHPAMFREFGIGVLIGFLLMTGIFLLEYYSGFIGLTWRGLSIWGILWTLLGAVFLFALVAVSEEFLFRGYLFQTFIQAVTLLPALLVTAALFGVGHWRNPNATILAVVNIALAGVMFSIAYVKTRSLWLPIGLHFSWNFSQTTVYSFPTSGMEFADRKLFSLAQGGPDWLTGGAFGPEGGLLATLAILIGTGVILKSKILAEPEGIITLDSIEDLLKPTNGDGKEDA